MWSNNSNCHNLFLRSKWNNCHEKFNYKHTTHTPFNTCQDIDNIYPCPGCTCLLKGVFNRSGCTFPGCQVRRVMWSGASGDVIRCAARCDQVRRVMWSGASRDVIRCVAWCDQVCRVMWSGALRDVIGHVRWERTTLNFTMLKST